MNIAEILKDKPKGTKLYSLMWGKCELAETRASKKPVVVRFEVDGVQSSYTAKGTCSKSMDECLLFPSKEMRDWQKFAWKPGAFLWGNDKKSLVLFCDWANDDYTKFTGGRFPTSCEDKGIGPKTIYNTCDYELLDLGKYELENFTNPTKGAFFFKVVPKKPDKPSEPIEPKHELKPFDKVVARNYLFKEWTADFFSHKTEIGLFACAGRTWGECLPYNEETAKLIGTTKSLEDIR